MKRLTGCLLCWVCLSVRTFAQAAPPAPEPQAAAPDKPAGPEVDNGLMLRLIRQMDANGDLLVDEKEFTAGFAKLEKEAAKVRQDMLSWLDRDKNGVLSAEELRPFEAAVALLPFLRSVDQNHDAALQDTELDAMFGRLAAFCQSANQRLLEEFDRDRDGKLSAEELQVARQGLQRAAPRPARGAGKAAEGSVVRAPAAGPPRNAVRDGVAAGNAQP